MLIHKTPPNKGLLPYLHMVEHS